MSANDLELELAIEEIEALTPHSFNPPNCARAGLRARETHHYLVRVLRP